MAFLPFKQIVHGYVCVSRGVYAHKCRYSWRPEEGIKFLGAGVTGNCELSMVEAGNQTSALYKSSKHS
ncbi:hypothetical protein I79_007276 [Cricetulus griseus]|uniref:Uncharacterized protein n=1 Tax=Cricetulus griseus TaxID=10029 RepID=G3HA34_CRIGR|nr:hypothetical protein I79_007276 [Cricetulus griseus]